MSHRSRSYTKVPNRFQDELQRDLPSTAYLVLLDIHRLTHGFHLESRRISQRTLARRLGKSYPTIRRAIDLLEEQDLLVSTDGAAGYSRDYRLTELALRGMLTDDQTPAHPRTPPLLTDEQGSGVKNNALKDRVKTRFTPPDPNQDPSGMVDTHALLEEFLATHPDAVAASRRRAARAREPARKANADWTRGDPPPTK